MNGLNYERMWIAVRHKVESEENIGIDGDGHAVFQPCHTLIQSMEECYVLPKKAEDVPPETEGPVVVMPGVYPDFRVMWFELSHAAETDPTSYQNLRKWMVQIEDEGIAESGDPTLRYGDKIVEVLKLAKSLKSGGKKAPDVSGFPETAAFRLSHVASVLIKCAGDLMELRDPMAE